MDPLFITLGLDGDECSASLLCRPPPPPKEAPVPIYRRMGGPRAILDSLQKSEISFLRREWNPDYFGCPTHSPSLYRLSYRDYVYS
jgi:hypothetical protein